MDSWICSVLFYVVVLALHPVKVTIASKIATADAFPDDVRNGTSSSPLHLGQQSNISTHQPPTTNQAASLTSSLSGNDESTAQTTLPAGMPTTSSNHDNITTSKSHDQRSLPRRHITAAPYALTNVTRAPTATADDDDIFTTSPKIPDNDGVELCRPPWPKRSNLCGPSDISRLLRRRVGYSVPASCPLIGAPEILSVELSLGPSAASLRLQVLWAPPTEHTDFLTGYRVEIWEKFEMAASSRVRVVQYELSKEQAMTNKFARLTISNSARLCDTIGTSQCVVSRLLYSDRFLDYGEERLYVVISALPEHGALQQRHSVAKLKMPSCRKLLCPSFYVGQSSCQFFIQEEAPKAVAKETVERAVFWNNTIFLSWRKPHDIFISENETTTFTICVALVTRTRRRGSRQCDYHAEMQATPVVHVALYGVFSNTSTSQATIGITHRRKVRHGSKFLDSPTLLIHVTRRTNAASLPSTTVSSSITATITTASASDVATTAAMPSSPLVANPAVATKPWLSVGDLEMSDDAAATIPVLAATVSAGAVILTVVVAMVLVLYTRYVQRSKSFPLSEINRDMLSNRIIRNRLKRLIKPQCLLDFLIQEGRISVDSYHYTLMRSGSGKSERARNVIKVMKTCDDVTFDTFRRYLRFGPLTSDFEPISQSVSLSSEQEPPPPTIHKESLQQPPEAVTIGSPTSHVKMVNTAKRVYITYSRYPDNLKQTVLHFATVLANCGVDVVLDQFYEVESADCLSEWVEEQFQAAHFILVILSAKYPLNLSSDERRNLAGSEDFIMSLYESKLLQNSSIGGRENFIIPAYFGFGPCPQSFIPLLLKNKTVYTVAPQCGFGDRGIQQMIQRFYQVNIISSSL